MITWNQLATKESTELEKTKYFPLGTFWSTKWNVLENSLVATVTGRDILETMKNTPFNTSVIYYDKTLYQLFEIILQKYGLTADAYELDSALNNIVVPTAWFNRISYREALQKLVDYAPTRLFITREGKVKVVYIPKVIENTSVYTFSNSASIITREFPLAWSDIANYIEVYQKTWRLGNMETVYHDNEHIITIPASSFLTVTYTYEKSPVDNAQIDIQTDTGVVISNSEAYAWGMVVTYYNSNIDEASITEVTITGQVLTLVRSQLHIAQDDESIALDGQIKLQQPINHDFIQTAEYAQTLGALVLEIYKHTKYHAKLTTRGHVSLQLTDKVNIEGLTTDYMIIQQQLYWDGSLNSTIELKPL